MWEPSYDVDVKGYLPRTKVMQGQLEYLGLCCCIGIFIMILISKIVSDLIVLCYNTFF